MLVAVAAALAATVSGIPPKPMASPSPTEKASPTRYCIVDTITGSRVPKKVCATRAQWQSRGVDIDRPNAR